MTDPTNTTAKPEISEKYLPLYLAEFTSRHNHRKDPNLFDSIVAGC